MRAGKTMNMFKNVSAGEWDAASSKRGIGSGLFTTKWECILEESFPYVSFERYRYRDTFLVRVVRIGDRVTSTPFSEGGDVLALAETQFNIKHFGADVAKAFGMNVRLRVNERFCPVVYDASNRISAKEHVLELQGNVHDRVRKTLRHILTRPMVGHIEVAKSEHEFAHAYRLYATHMRRVKNLALPYTAFRALTNDVGGELLVWRSRERLHAIALFLPNNTEVLYALSASDSHGLEESAAHYLVQHAFKRYQERGVKYMSLGTTGVDSALETFKRGWRGEEYAVYEVGGSGHEAARTSPLRSLTRLIPLSLYSRASLRIGKYFF